MNRGSNAIFGGTKIPTRGGIVPIFPSFIASSRLLTFVTLKNAVVYEIVIA
jgi:hypothetical protein